MAAKDRQYTVDCRIIDPQSGEPLVDPRTGAAIVNREAAQQAFLEAEALSARQGCAVTVMPIRVQQTTSSLAPDREYENIGYVFRLQVAPLTPQQKPQRQQTQRPPAALEGDEPGAVMPQQTDPSDRHAEGSGDAPDVSENGDGAARIESVEDLLPKLQ